MKIGLFTDTFPPQINGVANSTQILFEELKKNHQEAYVITTYKGIGEHKWNDDHTVLRLAGMELKFLYGYVMTSPIHLLALDEIKKLELDVIHAQTEFGVGIFARICAKRFGIPLISTYHTTYEDYTHYFNFFHMKSVDNISKKGIAALSRIYGDSSQEVIAPSRKTKELLERYNVRRRINVIPTGLQLEKFSPSRYKPERTAEIRREAGFRAEDVMIIYVGRLAKEKALDVVIDGFEAAARKGIDVKLMIVGGGPDLEPLRELVKKKGLENMICLTGPRPSAEVPDYYRAADAFISASLSETQGMTFIEAMASGIPLFARRDEVLEDLIDEEKTGWFFQDGSDLSDKLDAFVRLSKEKKRKISEACLLKAAPCSSAVFGNKVLEVYERAVEDYESRFTVISSQITEKGALVKLEGPDKKTSEIIVSMEDYYDFGIKAGKKLSHRETDVLIGREEGRTAYDKCLHKLSYKDRTEKEMTDFLSENTDCSEEQIRSVIDKLKKNGFIDDDRYCRETIARMHAGLKGRKRILSALVMKGIPETTAEKILDEEITDERDNAVRYAEKLMHSQREDSLRKRKSRIYARLIQHGYSGETASEALAYLDFSDAEKAEEEHLRKCVMKAEKKYRGKYRGSELSRHIYQYCIGQGFHGSDIQRVMEEVNNDEENQ